MFCGYRCASVMLGTSERFWLDPQAGFDLEEAHRLLDKTVQQIVKDLGVIKGMKKGRR